MPKANRINCTSQFQAKWNVFLQFSVATSPIFLPFHWYTSSQQPQNKGRICKIHCRQAGWNSWSASGDLCSLTWQADVAGRLRCECVCGGDIPCHMTGLKSFSTCPPECNSWLQFLTLHLDNKRWLRLFNQTFFCFFPVVVCHLSIHPAGQLAVTGQDWCNSVAPMCSSPALPPPPYSLFVPEPEIYSPVRGWPKCSVVRGECSLSTKETQVSRA